MVQYITPKRFFTWEEVLASDTATQSKIDNSPTDEHRKHIEEFVSTLLDKVREAWGKYCTEKGYTEKGIIITSGYRSEALNKKIGGSTTSAHSIGYAADTKPSNGKMKEYQEFIYNYLNSGEVAFDQYILEKPIKGVASWIHIGLKNRQGLQRKQNLLYKNGVYSKIESLDKLKVTLA